MRGPGEQQLATVLDAAVEAEESRHRHAGRPLEQLPGRTRGGQPALEQDQQAVGERPRLGAVVDDHQRRSRVRPQRGQGVLEQVRADLGVEAGERLVEQQHVGTDRDRPGQVHPPPLASREGRRAPLRQVVGADRAERLVRAPAPLGPGDAPPRERQHHVREHGPAGEVGRLERDPDPAAELDSSLGGCKRARERVEQRALASPVGSEQRDDLAGAKLRAHVVHHLALAAPDAQVLAAEQHRPGPILVGHVADRNRRRIPLPWCWSTASPHIRIRISPISTIATATASAK